MRRASLLAFLSVALLAPGITYAAPKKAPPPACKGRDILTEMKRKDPEGYAKVRAAADAIPNTKALLWRIEGKGQPASYLFGTIHSTDERVNKLSPAVLAAFGAANTVALEYVADESKDQETLVELITKKGNYSEGNGLKDILDTTQVAQLRKTLSAEGIPGEAVHLLRPWLAVLMLAVPPCERKRTEAGLVYLDQRIQRDALAQGKKVVGLETAQFQADALVGLPEATQIGLLKATVATIALRNDALEVLHRAYLARDLGVTIPFSKLLVEKAGYDAAPLDTFEAEIAVKRNFGMRDAALPLLEQGGAFIAVGALHVLGKDGLVELFRAAGYTVTAVE